MKALAFMDILREKHAIPWSTEGLDCSQDGMGSRSEVKRWLRMGAVLVDGVKVGMDTEINFPVSDVVFFPNGAAKMTTGPFDLYEYFIIDGMIEWMKNGSLVVIDDIE